MEKITIPAAEGRAIKLNSGQLIRITCEQGQQAADFFAYNAHDIGEWLSPNHTWVWTRSIRPRQGDVLLSRFRRKMLEFKTDGAKGVHDMMIAACDQFRYEQLGYNGPHSSCSENLRLSMQRLGHTIDVIPQPINFFTNTNVAENGTFLSPPNPVPAGSYVILVAKMDLICVVSSCPYDLDLPDWSINAASGPSDLTVEYGQAGAVL